MLKIRGYTVNIQCGNRYGLRRSGDRRCLHLAEKTHAFPGNVSGFTIVELMIVVVILGLLATAVVVNVSGYIGQSRIERTRMDIANLKNAVELFSLQRHHYPTNEEGLAILAERTAIHPSGIISELPKDSWGREYVYICPGQHGAFDIISLGRDGVSGGQGEDKDIVSWQLNDDSTDAGL